mgnify:CR=1 FL=1
MNKRNFPSIVLFTAFAALVFFFYGCQDEEENNLKQAPKLTHENSIEYYVTTTKVNDVLLITTKKDIYKNYKLLSSTTTVDTLPTLGNEEVTDEDNDGNEIKKTVPKAYDIFFKSERK